MSHPCRQPCPPPRPGPRRPGWSGRCPTPSCIRFGATQPLTPSLAPLYPARQPPSSTPHPKWNRHRPRPGTPGGSRTPLGPAQNHPQTPPHFTDHGPPSWTAPNGPCPPCDRENYDTGTAGPARRDPPHGPRPGSRSSMRTEALYPDDPGPPGRGSSRTLDEYTARAGGSDLRTAHHREPHPPSTDLPKSHHPGWSRPGQYRRTSSSDSSDRTFHQ